MRQPAFVLVLAVLVAALAPGVLAGQATFFHRDFSLFGYPLALFHRDCFWRGELPLLNPFNNSGLPFLAQWNTLTLYPPSLIYLVAPLSWSLPFFCLLHLWWGGLGMFRLARAWTGCATAGMMAGIFFAFSGLLQGSLIWPNTIAALGWMPWVAGAAWECIAAGGRRGLGHWVIVAGMQLLSGAPEVIGLTWVVVGVMGMAGWREGRVGGARGLGVLAVASLWALALAAVQVLPFLDLLGSSHRDARFAGGEWAIPRRGWANFLVPLLNSAPGHQGVWMQSDQYWIPTYYVGAITLPLAVWAAWRAPGRRWRWLLGLAVAGLILAMGDHTPLYPALRGVVPGVGFVRYPAKFVILPVFLLPLLAAWSVAQWRAGVAPAGWRALLALTGAVMVCVALAWGRPGRGAGTAEIMGNAGWRLVFLAAISALLVCRPAGRWKAWAPWLVAGLVWLDLRTEVPMLNPTVRPDVYQAGMVNDLLPADPRPAPGVSRAMLSPAAQQELRFSEMADPVKSVMSRRVALLGDGNLIDTVPKVNGFYSLYLREEAEVTLSLYATNALPPPAGLLDFLAVSHITAPGKLFDWERRPSAMPLVHGGQEPRFAGREERLERLLVSGFDPRRELLLDPADRSAASGAVGGEVLISSLQFSNSGVEFQVSLGKTGLVSVAQAWAPGWSVTIDGRAAPLLKANHAYQALRVPPGKHQVRLRYRERTLAAGAAISGFAWLAAATVITAGRRRKVD